MPREVLHAQRTEQRRGKRCHCGVAGDEQDATDKGWERTFSDPPPPKLRKELMVSLLAYRIQESAYGACPCPHVRDFGN